MVPTRPIMATRRRTQAHTAIPTKMEALKKYVRFVATITTPIRNSAVAWIHMCVCTCVCMYVCVYVHVCIRACVYVWCVFEYD